MIHLGSVNDTFKHHKQFNAEGMKEHRQGWSETEPLRRVRRRISSEGTTESLSPLRGSSHSRLTCRGFATLHHLPVFLLPFGDYTVNTRAPPLQGFRYAPPPACVLTPLRGLCSLHMLTSLTMVLSSQVPVVCRYITNQQEHHRHVSIRDELISILDKAGIDYNQDYIMQGFVWCDASSFVWLCSNEWCRRHQDERLKMKN